MHMMGSLVGSGILVPSIRRFPFLARKPRGRLGEGEAWSAECILLSGVTVVSILGGEAHDNSSPPSAASSCCHFMTSGALASEALF